VSSVCLFERAQGMARAMVAMQSLIKHALLPPEAGRLAGVPEPEIGCPRGIEGQFGQDQFGARLAHRVLIDSASNRLMSEGP